MAASLRGARQKGLLSSEELAACGLDADAISLRKSNGRLHALHQGLYVLGHAAVTVDQRFLAATKAAGREAALSHYAGAALRQYVQWDYREIEVTIPAERRVRRPGLVAHRAKAFGHADIQYVRGIPVTTPARTLNDLAGVVNERVLRRAVAQALGFRDVTIGQLVLTRLELGPKRGRTVLGEVLANAEPTRSELEDVVWDLLVGGGAKRPEVNPELWLSGRKIVPDFFWRAESVAVEADSRRWHDNPIARANDAERAAWLARHGIEVVPITWDQAVKTPEQTLRRARDRGVPFD